MHSPHSYILKRLSPCTKPSNCQHRRVSVYHKHIDNSIRQPVRKLSPLKVNKIMHLDTQTDIVDQIKNINYNPKQNKNIYNLNLDILFSRNQTSMSDLVRIREQLININISKQLEKLK